MGKIDWSKMITADQKRKENEERHLASVNYELQELRREVDMLIVPLQDAVDLETATPEETLQLKKWKLYRIELNRIPNRDGFPYDIEWPKKPQ